jgi:hypothetical protein
MRRLTRFGLTVFVVGALSAAAAAGASANYHIASPNGGSLVGTQTSSQFVLETQVGPVRCNLNKFEGWLETETAETLTVHPSYGGCKYMGYPAVHNTSYCNYTFGQTSKDEFGIHAPMSIACQTGKSIFVEDNAGFGCKITILPQNALSQIDIWAGTETWYSHYVIKNISYSWSPQCFNSGGKSGTASNGALIGTQNWQAFTRSGLKTSTWVD